VRTAGSGCQQQPAWFLWLNCHLLVRKTRSKNVYILNSQKNLFKNNNKYKNDQNIVFIIFSNTFVLVQMHLWTLSSSKIFVHFNSFCEMFLKNDLQPILGSLN
jgi:hypothetical protein